MFFRQTAKQKNYLPPFYIRVVKWGRWQLQKNKGTSRCEMPLVDIRWVDYSNHVQSRNVNWPGAVTSYLTVCITVEPV